MITREIDQETGIIIVSGRGAWTRADVDAHYDALRIMIAGLREAGKPIRVLSDVTRAERQDPLIESHILGQIARTFRAGDRLAVLTADAGTKAHTRTILGDTDVAAFASRMAAEMWLLLE